MSAQQILLNLLGNKCVKCGSCDNLELHHVDRNRQNNDLINIILLCKVCHEKQHGKRDENGLLQISVLLVGKSLKVTVPKEICEHLQLKKGDRISMWTDNSHVLFEKKAAT